MVNQTFSAHTDTIIFDNKLIFWGEEFNVDDKVGTWLIFESLFLEGIWGIRKQLPNEDLAISIQRFGDNIQKSFGLCLELHFLCFSSGEQKDWLVVSKQRTLVIVMCLSQGQFGSFSEWGEYLSFVENHY